MAAAVLEVGGWDIGGAHVKGAVARREDGAEEVRVAVRPFEIWRGREHLSAVLGDLADGLAMRGAQAMAVTMTAELSDAFRTKREGVLFVLDEVERAFPRHPLYVLSLRGEMTPLGTARRRPLDFAATNWVASALIVAERFPDCILMDVGSTTTDIIPIAGGRVDAEGWTDLARLTSGELVYTGALRTNPNTLTPAVPVAGRPCRVAAEHFAVTADVHLLLGLLSPAEYTCATADGRAASREAAAERLARLVCADGESLSEEQILQVARYLAEKQLQRITEGLLQVLSRLGGARGAPLVPAGVGSFLVVEVGRRLGLEVLSLEGAWGEEETAALPAAAAARLLARTWEAARG